MPKNIPPCPAVPQNVAFPLLEKRYEIELITPMFGGGVETRVNDTSFPIRPTAIRGQLQFWWRATVGAQYAVREDLRSAQSAIWGDTKQASRVQVRVENVQADGPIPCANYEPDGRQPGRLRSTPSWSRPFNSTALSYVLFPFQGQLDAHRQRIEVEPASCIHRARFTLTLMFHKDIDFTTQVEPAVWAWVNFGGLGSRTRRGCGSIVCQPLAPTDAAQLATTWKQYMPKLFPKREWPTLALSVQHHPEQVTVIDAWDRVIKPFRHFRQGVELGRNPGQQQNRPGRSRFPEPETIRRATDTHSRSHARLPQIPNNAFPRAELGLPIVFHFKDERDGDPPDTVLYPCDDSEGQKRERMASPLILKPLALQSGKAIPLILRLKMPPLAGVDLRRGSTSLPLPSPTVIRDPQLSSYPNSPLAGSPDGSALEAFLAFAQSEGFQEVTR